MKLYKATQARYALVHTDNGFFQIDNLGRILKWNDNAHAWHNVILSEDEADQLLLLGLGKLSEFKP